MPGPAHDAPMIVIAGKAALSAARIEKRLTKAKLANPELSGLSARFVHFVDVDEAALNDADRALLDRLLEYGPRDTSSALSGTEFWVVPRLGTISPWASKATDIAKICGLTQVRRIERGVAWVVAGRIKDEVALLATLHDRMTESVLRSERDAERAPHRRADAGRGRRRAGRRPRRLPAGPRPRAAGTP